jgi:hypothetical protein
MPAVTPSVLPGGQASYLRRHDPAGLGTSGCFGLLGPREGLIQVCNGGRTGRIGLVRADRGGELHIHPVRQRQPWRATDRLRPLPGGPPVNGAASGEPTGHRNLLVGHMYR